MVILTLVWLSVASTQVYNVTTMFPSYIIRLSMECVGCLQGNGGHDYNTICGESFYFYCNRVLMCSLYAFKIMDKRRPRQATLQAAEEHGEQAGNRSTIIVARS